MQVMACPNRRIVREVKKRRKLRDQHTKLLKEAASRRATWADTAAAFTISAEQCRTRWRAIRATYNVHPHPSPGQMERVGLQAQLPGQLPATAHAFAGAPCCFRRRSSPKLATNRVWKFPTSQQSKCQQPSNRLSELTCNGVCYWTRRHRCLCSCSRRRPWSRIVHLTRTG
ncbi:uncharacterized protein LOC144141566 [Haemaphysalis longicornis]